MKTIDFINRNRFGIKSRNVLEPVKFYPREELKPANVKEKFFTKKELSERPLLVEKSPVKIYPREEVKPLPVLPLNPIKPIRKDLFTKPRVEIKPMKKLITGHVIDTEKAPIYNANIKIVGSNTTSIADSYGKFKILAAPTDILEISSLGLETKKVSASSLNNPIVLKDDKNNLEGISLVAKKNNTLKYVGITLGVLTLGYFLFGKNSKKSKENKKVAGLSGVSSNCDNRVKCTGLKKNGRLKKGYKYGKGGVIVKVTKTPKKRAVKKPTSVIL